MKSVEQVIAETLGVRVDSVTDGLEFQQIPEWDSLNHVNLMLALEKEYDVEIDAEGIVSLTSVPAIRTFVASRPRRSDR
jgi:citrate synthase